MIRAFSFLMLFLLFYNLNAQELIDGFCRDGKGYFEFSDGEYFGECKNPKTMHGRGEYIFDSGAAFSGKWINGQKNGYGVSISSNGVTYQGDWANDQMHGLILETKEDGTAEFFIYLEGKKTDLESKCISGRCEYSSGIYTFVWKSGDRYHGNSANALRNGQGEYQWRKLDGSMNRYEGDWVDGERTGKGIFFWSNGDIYEGDFVEGTRTGKGKITWVGGNTYEGDFTENLRNGFGVWKNVRDDLSYRVVGETYSGMYKNGDRHGIGITSYPDGSYKVELNKDGEAFNGDGFCSHGNCENGRGTYVYKNGEYYEGKWSEGKRDGVGTLTNLLSRTSKKSLWGNDIQLCDYAMVTIQNNALVCDQGIFEAEQEREKERIRQERIAKEKKQAQEMSIDKITFLGVHWGMSLEEIKEEITIGTKCTEIGTRKITAIECYSDSVKKEDEFVRLDLINEYIYISCGVMNACDKSLDYLVQSAESAIDPRSTGIKKWESFNKLKLRTKEKIGIYLCAEGKKSGAICVTQESNIKGKPKIGGIYLLKSFIKGAENDPVITTSEGRIVKL